MQKKIESLEQERTQSNNSKLEEEVKEMQMKMQQFDYEN